MNKFRHDSREAPLPLSSADVILLIEDSVSLGTLVQMKLAELTAAEIRWCKTYDEARSFLAQDMATIAITGLNLPDAPHGEMLEFLAMQAIPTIVFTASLDVNLRDHYPDLHLVDYFVKDSARSVDLVAETILKFLNNRQVKILVVDDVTSIRSILTNILTEQNFHTLSAHSGDEALELLQQDGDIDIVITDYHMPDMNGQELIHEIRRLNLNNDLRIIGISSSSDRYLSASFLKAGASDFIYRPFIVEELQCRIDSNVQTVKQIKRLRYLAERDFLSKLYNRRAFFEKAERILDCARMEDTPAAVAILDVDHFKLVNDKYGHNTGDEAIKYVANILMDFEDFGNILVARLGGEEFCILFHDMDEPQVLEACESIRKTIADRGVPHEGKVIKITASIGVARVYHGEPIDNHLNAADQMLYIAKSSGRNQVHADFIYA